MADDDGESWTCPECTLRNEVMAEACQACGATSPLVLQSYAYEEQRASNEGLSLPLPPRSRVASQESDNATPNAEDMASELDPWTQAELEWAHVEAHQDETRRRK